MGIRVNSPWCILIWKHCLLCIRLLKIILPLLKTKPKKHSLYCGLVANLCPALCDPMDCSMPGFLVLYYLPEFAQTQVHRVGDTIQQSHPLSLLPPTFSLSQRQALFQWVSSLSQVAKVLELQLQHQSFQWFPSEWTGWISLQSKGLSRVFSNTTVQKHQFLGTQLSL